MKFQTNDKKPVKGDIGFDHDNEPFIAGTNKTIFAWNDGTKIFVLQKPHIQSYETYRKPEK